MSQTANPKTRSDGHKMHSPDAHVTDHVRHLYTSAAEWFDTFRYGMPTDSKVMNSMSKNAIGAAFDTHETGVNIAFINCLAEAGQAVGFQIRSKSAKVLSCKAHDLAGAAVWVYGANVHEAAAGDNCTISDMICHNTNQQDKMVHDIQMNWIDNGAIIDQGSNNNFTDISIEDCSGPVLLISAAAFGGFYQNFTASKICQATRIMRYAVVVEQARCENLPHLVNFSINDSPMLLNTIGIINSHCKPDLSGINVQSP
jgi:hypothetical protein